ncbi:MAG: hypothetical protein ABW175_25070, partial [Bradyrhizobium sp.]
MTVSMDGARLLRSAHQSWRACAAFNPGAGYRVSGAFRRRLAAEISSRACRKLPGGNVLGMNHKEIAMLYAILAYHDEKHVQSWTPQEDADVMTGLFQ